jgi:hypothetical protein
MRHVEESSNKKVLEFATPQDSIGGQQVNGFQESLRPHSAWAGESIIIPQSDHRS